MQNRKMALIVMAVGMLFTGIGIWRGELYQVMMKASIICLECVGIG